MRDTHNLVHVEASNDEDVALCHIGFSPAHMLPLSGGILDVDKRIGQPIADHEFSQATSVLFSKLCPLAPLLAYPRACPTVVGTPLAGVLGGGTQQIGSSYYRFCSLKFIIGPLRTGHRFARLLWMVRQRYQIGARATAR